MAIKFAIRNFIDEIQGRRLTIFTDHRPILGSWKNPDLQAHDPVALNAINEIAQHTSDIRYRPGKQLIVADLLSRPFGLEGQKFASPMAKEPEYVAPELTLAALQEVSLSVVSPEAIAEDQKNCPDVKLHQEGKCPKGVKMQDVELHGSKLCCEVSQANNPRPLLPKGHRELVVNLLHHQDHPG